MDLSKFDPTIENNMEVFIKGKYRDFYRYIKKLKKYVKQNLIYYAGNPSIPPNFDGYDENKIYNTDVFIPLICFDNKGSKYILKYNYEINVVCEIRRKLKNGNYITTNGDKNGFLDLKTNTNDRIRPCAHHVQLWSFFPKLNWKPFCETKGRSQDIQVDHILGDHKMCHINFLEVVTAKQNMIRANLIYKSKERNIKRGISIGKSLVAFSDGEPIKKKDDIIIFDHAHQAANIIFGNVNKHSRISSCLRNGFGFMKGIKFMNLEGKKITFSYSDSFNSSQKLLEIKGWEVINNILTKTSDNVVLKEQFILVEDLEDIRKEKIGKKHPKYISNFGRVKNNIGSGTITYGSFNENTKERSYNGISLFHLVYFAFAPLDDVKNFNTNNGDMICHYDGSNERYHPLVKRVSEYGEENSNIYGTFYVGNSSSNGYDKKQKNIRDSVDNKYKEFIVWDPKGLKINKTFYHIPDFVDYAKKYYNISLDRGGVWNALNISSYTQHKGFKFSFVIPKK